MNTCDFCGRTFDAPEDGGFRCEEVVSCARQGCALELMRVVEEREQEEVAG